MSNANAIDARASALPRSLAYSSLSYLTLVVLILFARTLSSHADLVGPIVDGGEVFTPTTVNVIEKLPDPGGTPPATPAKVPAGIIVPVKDAPLVDDTLITAVVPNGGIQLTGDHPGTGPALVGTDGGGGGGDVTDPDPPLGKFIWVENLPELVTRVTPEYPAIARQAGLEGDVLLAMQIGTDGRVHRVTVVRSNMMFDSAAVEAARKWVFTPATSNRHPVVVWVQQAIHFTLHE